MVNIQLFLYFFKKENIFNILFFFTLASLLFLGDIFFLVFLMRLMGTYLAFTVFFFFTAVGQVGLFRTFSLLIDNIREAKDEGENCMDYYLAYAGSIPAVIYMIYPGIISTLIGFILLIFPIRKVLGEFITKKLQLDWDEINEYLFLLIN